jgi:hypothetical protein
MIACLVQPSRCHSTCVCRLGLALNTHNQMRSKDIESANREAIMTEKLFGQRHDMGTFAARDVSRD